MEAREVGRLPYCSDCGREVPLEASFCSNCGHDLRHQVYRPASAAPAPGSSAQAGDKPHARADTVGKVIGVILVLLLLGAVFYYVLVPVGMGAYGEASSVYPEVNHAGSAQNAAGTVDFVPAPLATYDEQEALAFSGNYQSLAYNVTVAAQNDSRGYGPAYLLNGLTQAVTGYWYQVGVSYDWALQSPPGYLKGFHFIYAVLAPGGTPVYPPNASGEKDMNVNSGDVVLLELYFSAGNVTMYAHDWNTSSTQQTSYSAEGGAFFVGLSGAPQERGFFTGPMTEWYHVDPYYGQGGHATYSSSVSSNSGEYPTGYMMIDEYNSATGASVFSQSKLVSYATAHCIVFVGQKDTCGKPPLQYLSYEGATEGSSQFEFTTG